jgi:hypothetical protein
MLLHCFPITGSFGQISTTQLCKITQFGFLTNHISDLPEKYKNPKKPSCKTPSLDLQLIPRNGFSLTPMQFSLKIKYSIILPENNNLRFFLQLTFQLFQARFSKQGQFILHDNTEKKSISEKTDSPAHY